MPRRPALMVLAAVLSVGTAGVVAYRDHARRAAPVPLPPGGLVPLEDDVIHLRSRRDLLPDDSSPKVQGPTPTRRNERSSL